MELEILEGKKINDIYILLLFSFLVTCWNADKDFWSKHFFLDTF